VAGVRDKRRRPQIATATVWLCVFAMFALRLQSFNALEEELRRRRGWERWVGGRRLPTADTLGRVLAGTALEEPRALVATLTRRAWRAKAIHGRPGETYRVVAVDGHELWASRARCCAECLIREVRDGEATVRNRLEVYRRQTEPLLDYYRQRSLLAPVSGEGPVATIRDAIRTSVGAAR